MSDTPRTDSRERLSHEFTTNGVVTGEIELVDIEWARQLERELARVQKALVWLWLQLCAACDIGAIPRPDVPRDVVNAVDAARALDAKEPKP